METETTEERKINLTPTQRFSEFEEEWKESRFKIIAIVNPKTENLPSKFTYIDLESVTKGRLVKKDIIYAEEAPSRAQRVLAKKDILYQTVRPYQRNNFFFNLEGDFVASTGYAQIKAKGDPEFLFHYLHTTPFVNLINRWSTGTSYPAISPSELAKMKVIFPSLPEQQKIASFLSAVDKKIQQLTRKKELLETYKKGVMQQLFSQEIRFKDEDGKDFPEWERKRIGQILKIGSGRDYKHLNSGKIPVFGTGGLMTFVDESLYDGESVGIGRKGTIDKPVFLTGKFWTVDTLFYTHSFSQVLPKFVYSLFQQINWKKHNEASGVPSLSKNTIEKLKVIVPSEKEQQKIADFISAIDRKIETVQQQITKTQSFKKGLLQQMFV